MAEDIRELLNIAPAEIKLSEIAEDMIRDRHDDDCGEVITVIVERNEYRSTWLYLDEERHHPLRDKYQCRHSLLLNEDGTISSARLDKRDLKDTQNIGRSYGLADKIRAYYAAGTKIVLDEDAVVTSVGDY